MSKRGMVVSQRIQTLLSLKNPNLAFISLGDRNFKGIKGYKPIHNINSEPQKHHLKITLHIFSQICHCRIQVYISWYLLAMAGKKKKPRVTYQTSMQLCISSWIQKPGALNGHLDQFPSVDLFLLCIINKTKKNPYIFIALILKISWYITL